MALQPPPPILLRLLLMDGDLNKLKSLFEIAKAFEANMRGNYFISILPGVVCLAGYFYFVLALLEVWPYFMPEK